MIIIKTKNYEELSKKAADIIGALVVLKPNAVLGLATGSTPVGTYQQLIKGYEEGKLDFSNIKSVNLDEYKGLTGDHDQSYRYFMNTNLFDHINIDKANTNVPSGIVEDGEAECERYNQLIKELGGIDLQLLGIGGNAHIGFNEPCDEFVKGTHLVTLEEDTREANARFFTSIDEVPTQAYTMGIQNIMSAKKILLLANGKAKAQAVYDTCFGPVKPQVPASILQLHEDCIVIADEDALSLCVEKGVM